MYFETTREQTTMDATLQVIRIEPRVSPDPVSEPDYLLTTMDGDHVVESMRYGDADVATYGPERVRGWVPEDHARHRAWERDEWRFVDVRLVAVVGVSAGGRQVGTLEIDGPVLGGVESDGGDEYMSSVVDELAGEFRGELVALGFAASGETTPTDIIWEA